MGEVISITKARRFEPTCIECSATEHGVRLTLPGVEILLGTEQAMELADLLAELALDSGAEK